MTPRQKKRWLLARAEHFGLHVSEHKPGDGVTRYRIHPNGSGYFDGNHLTTQLGINDAVTWLDGYTEALKRMNSNTF